jgi:hypothetical protein
MTMTAPSLPSILAGLPVAVAIKGGFKGGSLKATEIARI